MAAPSNTTTTNKNDNLRNEFRMFDINNDGYITGDELKIVLQKILPNYDLPDSEIKRMISNVDLDKDGRINYDEFIQSIHAQPKK